MVHFSWVLGTIDQKEMIFLNLVEIESKLMNLHAAQDTKHAI